MAVYYKSASGERQVLDLYAKVLEGWPVPFETLEVATRHGRTSVIAFGDSGQPALILLHGSCSNSLAWGGDAGKYASRFRVYAVDIPGEPGRSEPARAPLRGPAFAEWLDDVLNGLRVERASLVGLSFGAWAAMKFASAHPDRVEKLALLAPGGITQPRLSFILRAMLIPVLGKGQAAALNRLVLGGKELPEDAALFARLVAEHFRPRVEALPLLTDDELDRLSMPVLMIAGQEDAIYPSARSAARLRRNSNVDVRVLPSCGHVLLDAAQPVIEFLA